MELPEPFRCDECGSLKRETNHWFLIRWDRPCDGGGLVIRPWNRSRRVEGDKEACGEACVLNLLSIGLPGLHGSEGSSDDEGTGSD